MPRLKVFRTPIGFHDAYVAAPSQKAALKAWGSDADLFARGVAEVVTDPDLTAEPLARPGEVIRRSRGSVAEQLAALPPDRPKGKTKAKSRTAKVAVPRPDRAAVEAAETALAEAEARQREDERKLAEEEAKLAERRRMLRADHAAERERLEAARDAAEIAYADALRRWREGGPASGA
jgi:hypothetical protein